MSIVFFLKKFGIRLGIALLLTAPWPHHSRADGKTLARDRTFCYAYELYRHFPDTKREVLDKFFPGMWAYRTRKTMRSNFRHNHAHFKAALKDGDPNIKFMEDELGFRIGDKPGDLYIPPTMDALKKYNSYVKSNYNPEDILLAARIFRSRKTGKIIYLLPGDPIPKGATASFELLNNREWLQAYADGYQPTSSTLSADVPWHSVFEHDLGHVVSNATHPAYAKEVRIMAKKALDGDFLAEPTYSNRLHVVHEMLTLIRGDLDKMDLLLDLPAVDHKFLSVNLATEHLSGKNNAELKLLSKKLREQATEFFDPIGGVSADVKFRNFGPINRGAGTGLTSLLYNMLEQATSPLLLKHMDREQKIKRLAVLQVAMRLFSKITPEQVVREGLDKTVNKSSELFHIFCKSGIFALSDPLRDLRSFNSFCK